MNLHANTPRRPNWPQVQRALGSLPPVLFRQVMLLSHDLALKYSDSGQFEDILTRRRDYPLLDQHMWLLADFDLPNDAARDQAAGRILQAVTFTIMAVEILRAVEDPGSLVDVDREKLASVLLSRAEACWKMILPESASLLDFYRSCLSASLAADGEQPAGYLALAALPVAGTALWAGRDEALPELLEMVGHLAAVIQAVQDLADLRRDLRDGRVSDPIRRAMQATGADRLDGLSVEYLVGALIFTGVLGQISRECEAHLEAARVIAAGQALPSFVAYTGELETLLKQVWDLFSLRADPADEAGVLRAFFTPAPPLLDYVLRKAEGYLIADLSFRESWEVQMTGTPGLDTLVGSTFPVALVLEVLCLNGVSLQEAVDGVLSEYTRTGFRYYDDPRRVPPDADDVAFALRLCRFSSRPAWARSLLEDPLRWMRMNQHPSGQIPVWFSENDSPHGPVSPLTVLYGGSCATVEANLLIALLEDDWEAHRDVIETASRSWCERWLDVGLGATSHYTPFFSFWAGLELTRRLRDLDLSGDLAEIVLKVRALLLEMLAEARSLPEFTSQDAAFLVLSSLSADAPDFPLDPAWITKILKHQRNDGSWAGEPTYIVPSGRGMTTLWHCSRLITTAFCYHALVQYRNKNKKVESTYG